MKIIQVQQCLKLWAEINILLTGSGYKIQYALIYPACNWSNCPLPSFKHIWIYGISLKHATTKFWFIRLLQQKTPSPQHGNSCYWQHPGSKSVIFHAAKDDIPSPTLLYQLHLETLSNKKVCEDYFKLLIVLVSADATQGDAFPFPTHNATAATFLLGSDVVDIRIVFLVSQTT